MLAKLRHKSFVARKALFFVQHINNDVVLLRGDKEDALNATTFVLLSVIW